MFLACFFCLGLVRCASGLLVGWWGAGALAPEPPRAPFGRAPAPPPPEVTIYLLAMGYGQRRGMSCGALVGGVGAAFRAWGASVLRPLVVRTVRPPKPCRTLHPLPCAPPTFPTSALRVVLCWLSGCSLGARWFSWVLVGSLGCSLGLLGARWVSCLLVGSLACSLGARWFSCLLLRAEAGNVVRCSGRGCGCGFSGLGCVGAPPFGCAHRTPPKALPHPTPPPMRSSDIPHLCPARCPVLALWVLVGCSLGLLGARWLSWVLVGSLGCSLALWVLVGSLACDGLRGAVWGLVRCSSGVSWEGLFGRAQSSLRFAPRRMLTPCPSQETPSCASPRPHIAPLRVDVATGCSEEPVGRSCCRSLPRPTTLAAVWRNACAFHQTAPLFRLIAPLRNCPTHPPCGFGARMECRHIRCRYVCR